MMFAFFFIFLCIIGGIIAGDKDVYLCSGTLVKVDTTISELNFYRLPKPDTNTNNTQFMCNCYVRLTSVLDNIMIQSQPETRTCNDWITITHGVSTKQYTCGDSIIYMQIGDNNGFQVTLHEKRPTDADKYTTVTPLKIALDPPQSSLSVSCAPGIAIPDSSQSSSTPSSVTTSLSSTTSSNAPTEPSVNSTITLVSPSSKTSFTPLIVGLVGIGVIAGSCVVCAVLCRLRRQSGEKHERIHQTVYRKASTMYKAMVTRPLPSVPTSMRRVMQLDRLRKQDSGLYDSIKSNRSHAKGVKPKVTPQQSSSSSVYYITPVDVSKDKPSDCDGDTYLTSVILNTDSSREQNNASESFNQINERSKTTKEGLKESISNEHGQTEHGYQNLPKNLGYVHARIRAVENQNAPKSTSNLAASNRQEGVYMSMRGSTPGEHSKMKDGLNSGSSNCLIDNDQVTLENETKSSHNGPANHGTESSDRDTEFHVGADDDTFPQLIKFDAIYNGSNEITEQNTKTKPTRYIRDLSNQTTTNDTCEA